MDEKQIIDRFRAKKGRDPTPEELQKVFSRLGGGENTVVTSPVELAVPGIEVEPEKEITTAPVELLVPQAEPEPNVLQKIVSFWTDKGPPVAEIDYTSPDNPKFDSDGPGTLQRDLGGNRRAAFELGMLAASGLGVKAGLKAAAGRRAAKKVSERHVVNTAAARLGEQRAKALGRALTEAELAAIEAELLPAGARMAAHEGGMTLAKLLKLLAAGGGLMAGGKTIWDALK